MIKKYFYIANWKMNWNFTETVEFVARHYDQLIALGQKPDRSIVLCPSTTALYPLIKMFEKTHIAIGAQDCSDHQKGAFTGQISAEDIKSVGGTFCIVGHSERRRYNNESDEVISKKLSWLLDVGIVPIICIGETFEQYQQGTTLPVVKQQLNSIIPNMQRYAGQNIRILVAYEPVWAIGSGLIPSIQHLQTVFTFLKQVMTTLENASAWSLLYGGSISSKNIHIFKQIELIDGFLIGGASLDFQELQNIIK